MNEFRKILAELKDGTEPLLNNDQPTGFKLIDFWRWSVSDLLSNATRGRFAEFIVGTAIGSQMDEIRDEWDAFDLISKGGVKVEVKSAAYLQSWSQKGYSKITFSIKPAKTWNSDTGEYCQTKLRSADVYVFCLLKHKDPLTINPMNVDQWEFFVVDTPFLNELFSNYNSISLSVLRKHGTQLKYEDLAQFIDK